MNSLMEQALWHVRALDLHLPRAVAMPLQRAVKKLASRSPTALSILYDTDKGPQGHLYTERYRQILGPLRRRGISMLEIGILDGASLRLWRHYLPKATIVGIDLKVPEIDLPGVQMCAGDQSDPVFLAHLVELYGPFDLVIDDGSHVASHIRASFEALFPALTPGGWYVIEDLETSYIREPYEGGPIGTPGTAVELVKSLVDRAQSGSGVKEIAQLQIFEGIAFIQKATASDQYMTWSAAKRADLTAQR